MAPGSPSPPLIKGINGIVSRPPNEVNYSTLNGKRMEIGKQTENEIRQAFKIYGMSKKMVDISLNRAFVYLKSKYANAYLRR